MMGLVLGAVTKFIPFRFQIYALAVVVVIAAVLGIYWKGGENAIIKVEAKRDKKRLKSLIDKAGFENDNENKTDSDLADGITRSKRVR